MTEGIRRRVATLASDFVLLVDWRVDRPPTMLLRIGFRLIVLALVVSGFGLAPVSLRGETTPPPDSSAPPSAEPAQKSAAGAETGKGHIVAAPPIAEIITDLS